MRSAKKKLCSSKKWSIDKENKPLQGNKRVFELEQRTEESLSFAEKKSSLLQTRGSAVGPTLNVEEEQEERQ